MINFNKITKDEIDELKSIAAKAVEKSEFEKIYLYTLDLKEKCKLFLFSYRFLNSAVNLLEEGDLRNEIKKVVDNTHKSYMTILHTYNVSYNFGKRRREEMILEVIENNSVKEIIDLFSILVERVNLIKISRLKGILLEGKSAEEYKKVFNDNKEFKPIGETIE